MALVVGTNTYSDEAHAADYIELMGLNSLPPDEAESLLKRATRALDDIYGPRLAGSKTDADQPLEWPRDGDAEIPSRIADAAVEMALLLAEGVNIFAPEGPVVQSESFSLGPISESKTYAVPHRESSVFHRLDMLLGSYLVSTSSVRLVRG